MPNSYHQGGDGVAEDAGENIDVLLVGDNF